MKEIKVLGLKVVKEIQTYASKLDKRVILTAESDRGKKTALNRFYKNNNFKKPGRKRDYSIPRHSHIWSP